MILCDVSCFNIIWQWESYWY